MSDPVNLSQVSQTLVENAGQGQDRNQQGPQGASSDDVRRFEDAMNGPSGADPSQQARQVQETQGSEQARAAQDPQPVDQTDPGQPPSLGDAILKSMEGMRAGREEQISRVNATLGKDELSMQDSMRLQYELSMMNLQTDVTAKGADKAGEGLKTLFRNQ